MTSLGRRPILPLRARKLRVEYPGAIYPMMNRGDRREPIFKDDADRQRFAETLGESCVRRRWQAPAYGLMPNHLPGPSTADRFSPSGGDAASDTGGRNEIVAGHLFRLKGSGSVSNFDGTSVLAGRLVSSLAPPY